MKLNSYPSPTSTCRTMVYAIFLNQPLPACLLLLFSWGVGILTINLKPHIIPFIKKSITKVKASRKRRQAHTMVDVVASTSTSSKREDGHQRRSYNGAANNSTPLVPSMVQIGKPLRVARLYPLVTGHHKVAIRAEATD